MYEVIAEDHNGKREVCATATTAEGAEASLIEVLEDTISNFDAYSAADIEAISEQKYERWGGGILFIEEDGVSLAHNV